MKTCKFFLPPLVLVLVLFIPFHISSQDLSRVKKPPPEFFLKHGFKIPGPGIKSSIPPEFIRLVSWDVDESTARKTALNFSERLKDVSGRKSLTDLEMVYKATRYNSFKKTQENHSTKDNYFYVFSSTEANMYFIIAADKRAKPILAYSTTSSFDPENAPPNLMNWLRVYEKQIQYSRDHSLLTDASTQSEWQSLLDNTQLITEPMMEPLIQTWWGQSPYYNDLCPIIPPEGKRATAGCLATAMAQIMRYWRYPDRGTGSHSYIPESYPELGSISVNFEEAVYNWDAMPDSINSPNDEIARLIFHCGVSTNMDYGPAVSWASIKEYNHPCAHLAFPNFFGYKHKCLFLRRNEHTHEDWLVRIISELTSGRPVLYSGGGEDFVNAGHIFTCDGYDNKLNLHFNWGWKGVGDGYFSTHAINLLDFFDFTQNQNALIEIEPLTHNPEADVRASSKPIISPCNYLSMKDTVNLKIQFKNFGKKSISGYFMATFWDSDGYLVGGSVQPQIRELKPGMNTGELSFTSAVKSSMVPGVYNVFFAIQTPEDSTVFIQNSWNDSVVCNSHFRLYILEENESIPADEYEDNDSENLAHEIIPEFEANKASMQLSPTIHHINDIDYFKIKLPPGENYTISSLLIDYQTNLSYIFDGKYSCRIGESPHEWSMAEDVDILDFKLGPEDSIVYFKVEPFLNGYTGFYEIEIDITKEIENPSFVIHNPEQSIFLYPNPTRGSITLKLVVEDRGMNEITIYNLEGRQVFKTLVQNQGDMELQLSPSLPAGIYVVHVKNKKRNIVQKIMVSK
jgi:hypothetical protein